MDDIDKTVGGYVWGAPIWAGRKSSAKGRRAQIIAHLGYLLGANRTGAYASEASSKDIDDYIYAYHSRLTDKSAALLQTVAVIAAIEGVFVAQAQQAGGDALIVGYAALGAFGVCALCLVPNLLVYWPRWLIEARTEAAKGQTIWRNSMIHMVQKRTWKHQLAVCLLGAGILLCAWDRASAITHLWPHNAPQQKDPEPTPPVQTPAQTPAPIASAPNDTAAPITATPEVLNNPSSPTIMDRAPVVPPPNGAAVRTVIEKGATPVPAATVEAGPRPTAPSADESTHSAPLETPPEANSKPLETAPQGTVSPPSPPH